MFSISKTEQRLAAQAARKALPDELRRQHNKAICNRIAEHPAVKKARVIMSYLAFAGEVDLTGLHESLRNRDLKLCFPVCAENGFMQAFFPRDQGALEAGKFGIFAPVPERSDLIDPEEIEVVLTPCVAFDASRMRLGWGGGYYDRFLPRCPKAFSIAAAYEVQRVE